MEVNCTNPFPLEKDSLSWLIKIFIITSIFYKYDPANKRDSDPKSACNEFSATKSIAKAAKRIDKSDV
jgi:hypothetical protein